MSRPGACGTVGRWGGVLVAVVAGLSPTWSEPVLIPLQPAVAWQRLEFAAKNIPSVDNPFDPEQIRVEAQFTLPSGGERVVPGFWFLDHIRTLANGAERLSSSGLAGWRLRFTPPEPGDLRVQLLVKTNGVPVTSGPELVIPVGEATPGTNRGYVRLAPGSRYFGTSEGRPLPLIGANVCWPGARGTFDYDTWFAAMEAAGQNFARIWMAPWAFGIETEPGSLNRYRLDRAWQLDHVVWLAEQRGIYLLLCLDYHGMFETQPDFWGSNNNWPLNPYNAVNGGPATNQNQFFTSSAARSIYQKRLRYLVARYGHSPNVLGWEFFNEIDNVYRYLQPADVAAWHSVMGEWLRANDPYGHLVSTSLTGGSERPEIWSLPPIDFASYHSYNETGPAERLATIAATFRERYGKPVMIGEFGTDWRGWRRENDPHLRGLRQGLWGGALGGSTGSAMSWWWENLHSENVYPLFRAMHTILSATSWGRGSWTNLQFVTSGPPPVEVGELVDGGAFAVTLTPGSQWGHRPVGQLAVPSSDAERLAPAALNAFVHGTAHTELRVPFHLSAWLTNAGRLVAHLNSVSDGAVFTVRVDGTEIHRRSLPNRDGVYLVNGEYNEDLFVDLPAGKHLVEIRNAGRDWFYLDWVRLEGVLPATYAGGWAPSPSAIGLAGDRESLVYVVSPGCVFPAGATNEVLPPQTGRVLKLAGRKPGTYEGRWHDPKSGAVVGTTRAATSNEVLTLAIPDHTEDLVGVIVHPARLSVIDATPSGGFRFRLESEAGGRFVLERAGTPSIWQEWLDVTNALGELVVADPSTVSEAGRFYRARRR